jgi:hypothetical protein
MFKSNQEEELFSAFHPPEHTKTRKYADNNGYFCKTETFYTTTLHGYPVAK